MKTSRLILALALIILIGGCVQQQKEVIDADAKFPCENDNSVQSRGYILLMGLGDHTKEVWAAEKILMEQDPKTRFVLIYDQDENSHIENISKKFLADADAILTENPVEELVIFGSSAGGVTSSYSISRLDFSGPVALHTLASPIGGYDLTGWKAQFLGDRQGFLRDIAIGFGPFEKPGDNVKVYHHKTVTDTILKDYYCGDMAAFCDVREIQNNNIEGSKEFYYPQYDHDTIMGAVIRDVLKCYNPAIEESLQKETSSPRLGSLCIGEEACNIFCKDSMAKCQEYCNSDSGNPLCQKPFAFQMKLVEAEQETRPETVQKIIEEPKEQCSGTKTKFSHAPVNLDKTLVMLPLGLTTGNHVTPIDHHYFQNFNNDGFDIEVYSPGDGYVTEIGHMPGAKEGEDYRVVIEHTCTVSSIYIHVGTLSEKLKTNAVWRNGYSSVRIPVKAGETIGFYEKNVDYNLVDEEFVLKGFIVPEHYDGESWKIHVPNTYDYFNEPVRSQLVEKSVRTVEPISGKIDYDIDGRLVGNWFLEGTGGYGNGGIRPEYWSTHLSFTYNGYDPSQIIVSIGNFNGEPKQFAVKGNSPDPADVSTASGLVKYELLPDFDYITEGGSSWDRVSFAKISRAVGTGSVSGVVLVQMTGDRKIKFEAFPDKTSSEVSRFTQNAKTYER
ncbi:MAG: hypothetical protein HYW27_02450 [Candidatus Aenigmarchaeota archaeon]|nr:hypothetical protein [Candidatus Aenigmarchaeota archaeon]